jgi:hypothetical protein
MMGIDEGRIAQIDGRDLHSARRSDGSWTCDPREIGAFVAGGSVTGTITARAFAMFMGGKSDPEVVVATMQPARHIRDLRAEYDQMRGSLTIGRDAIGRLERALGAKAVQVARHSPHPWTPRSRRSTATGLWRVGPMPRVWRGRRPRERRAQNRNSDGQRLERRQRRS